MGLQLSFGNVILSKKNIQNKIIWSFLGLSPPKWRAADVSTACPETRQKPLERRTQERANFPRFDSKILQILQHGPFWAVRIGWTSPHFEWCQKPPPGNKPGAYDMRVPQTDSNCNFLHSRGLQSLSVLGAIADSIFPTPANCQSTAVANSVASPEILWDDLVSMKASNPSWNSDLVMIPSCKIQLATGLRAIKMVLVRGIGTESTGITIPSTRRSMNAYAWGLKKLRIPSGLVEVQTSKEFFNLLSFLGIGLPMAQQIVPKFLPSQEKGGCRQRRIKSR